MGNSFFFILRVKVTYVSKKKEKVIRDGFLESRLHTAYLLPTWF